MTRAPLGFGDLGGWTSRSIQSGHDTLVVAKYLKGSEDIKEGGKERTDFK